MYLSAATNRITVTWGNYGKVRAQGAPRGAQGAPRGALQSLLLILSSLSPQSYSVGLYLVRQMTSAELLQRLKTIGIKHPELCKALGEWLRESLCVCSLLGITTPPSPPVLPSSINPTFYLNRLAELCVSRGR